MDKKVSKKMLINTVHPEEARVAIVHDGRLMELNVEITGKEQLKGNIYKGVVVRVEPSLQAAFVDIGRAKPGFLQMGELHPDYWQWRDDIPEEQRKRRPRIQEVLRRGQELMVQVEKDERDHKGSALTSYISLPGRYMVIMPGGDAKGISRKVEQEGERKKLKEIVAAMNIPEGIGYIIRTEAVGRTAEEITKDFENLLALYEDIRRRTTEISGAGEVYQDKGLICRFIRDYFSDDIDEVLVDSKDAYRDAKEYFSETMPKCEKLVKLHKEKRPIFSRFQLEEQIDQIYEKRVALPSGGYLIIEPTEALVSIDVNSGKSSSERGIEETAFKTNLEAVEETARQLRLRDLGGLIVIDCIDMREKKHDIEVEKTLKQALKMDKARVNVGRISEFGMLEMSRQRIAKTLNDAIHLECPHCEGRGKVKSVEAMAVSFLRKVHGAAAKGTVSEVHGGLPLEVAYYLLNRKKRELVQIENDYDITVTVKGKTSFLLNQLELEIVKREKIREEESSDVQEKVIATPTIKQKAAITPETEESEPEAAPTPETDVAKKRKRRRKKKKTAAEEVEQGIVVQENENLPHEAPSEPVENGVEADATEEGTTPAEAGARKKRKRRRKKPVRKPEEHGEDLPAEHAVAETIATAAVADREDAIATAPGSDETEPEIAAATRPKRKRPPRKRKPANEQLDATATHEEIPTASVQTVEPVEAVQPPPTPKKSSRKKPTAVVAESAAETAPVPVQETLPAKKKASSRSTKKAVPTEDAHAPDDQSVTPPEAIATPKPRSRKKTAP